MIDDHGELHAQTQVILSRARRASTARRSRYRIELEPRERWELGVDVSRLLGRRRGRAARRRAALRRRARARPRLARRLAAARAAAARDLGRRSRTRSARRSPTSPSLRMRADDARPSASCPAAGMPWFMTVFGRDTLITCLQTLLFGPELARSALARARRAAGDARTTRRSTPSPGRSSTRCATARRRETLVRRATTAPSTRRRSTSILLSEVWRWTDDAGARARAAGARARARSSGSTSTATSTATASSSTSAVADAASRTSRGRTPATRSASTTARIAEAPIAPCEVQGYVYDAKRRHRRARARGRGATATLAERLEREADELRTRFDEAFWIEERGGYYALALDGEKQPVDSLCSNIGHLLWSGIVPPERVDAVVDQLMGDGALVGLGRAHDVDRRRRLQPARATTTARSGPTTTR